MSKKTLATTVRCDARDAAELVLFFKSRGVKVDNISDLLRKTITALTTIAKNNGLVAPVHTTLDAMKILSENGVYDLLKPRDNRNYTTLLKDLSAEDVRIDGQPTSLEEFQPTPEMLKQLDERLEGERSEQAGIASGIPNIVEDDYDGEDDVETDSKGKEIT